MCDVHTLQKTKIPKRGLIMPKLLTEEEWIRINNHLMEETRKKSTETGTDKKYSTWNESPLIVDCSKKHLKNLETSKTGTGQRMENRIMSEMGDIKRPLKSQAKEEEIINRAKTIIFENKEYARRVLHGLKQSSILHERNGQIEFNQNLRRKIKILEKKMNLKLNEETLKYQEELKNKKIEEKERIENFRKELDRQLREKIENRNQAELEKMKERNDIFKMNEELKSLAEEERVIVEEKKQRLKRDIENYARLEEEIKAKEKMKEVEQEEVNKIYQIVAWELDGKRRDRERSRFVMKPSYLHVELVRDTEEPLKGYRDGDKKLKEFLQMREARKSHVLRDILMSKKVSIEEIEKRTADNKSERKRLCLIRCKKDEADRNRILKDREERIHMMKKLMQFYIHQWKEKEERERMEKEMDKIYIPDIQVENEVIGKYCDEILNLAKRNKRPLYPILAAVKGIKKEFGLETQNTVKFLKSNVPIGKNEKM